MIRELENPVTLFGYPVHLKSNLMFLFLISGALRLLVYLIFLPKVREVRDVEPFSFKEMFQRRSRSSSPSK